MHELFLRRHEAVNQKVVRISYKDLTFEEPLRFDVVVENCLLVAAKCVESILPTHKAQVLSYMKLLDIPVGLIINFNEVVLKNGITRLTLPGVYRV
jgi:GxxExxY protein